MIIQSHRMNWIAFLPLLPPLLGMAGAQPTTNNDQYPYARFSPSMAIIIVVLIAALFFMGFFSIYIRHCSDSSSRGPAGSIRRALSRRAAARGLDPSVLETFPTFTYSEVKDHKIGKRSLECAVCLNEFEPDETLRLIPRCDHVFHPECIDAWLESHVTCPVCRANLVPEAEAAVASDDSLPSSTPPQATTDDRQETRSDPRSNGLDHVVVQVDDDNDRLGRSASLARSWSTRMAKVAFGFGKFRSHSTGHSVAVVQPVENLDRFTLRLPEQVRKEVIDRAMLNRTGSCAVPLPRGGSTRSNRGRSYRRIEREGKSDRWLFFSRGLSVKSPKVVDEAGDGSVGTRTPVKMPSIKCLEPKAADETGLFSEEPDSRSSV